MIYIVFVLADNFLNGFLHQKGKSRINGIRKENTFQAGPVAKHFA